MCAALSPDAPGPRCAYASARGTCKQVAEDGRMYCQAHSCPMDGCANPKSSRDPDCGTAHTAGSAQPRSPTPLRGFEPDLGENGRPDSPVPVTPARALRLSTRPVEIEVSVAPPFGIRLNGSAEAGIFVVGMTERGNAAATGQIKVGSRILEVSGTGVLGFPKPDVVALLKAADGPTTLRFSLPADVAAQPPNDASVVSVSLSPPFGLKLNGSAEMGVYVVSVQPGGKAASSGLVHSGHRIVAIGNSDVSKMDKPGVVGLLKTTDGPTNLTFVADLENYQRKFGQGASLRACKLVVVCVCVRMLRVNDTYTRAAHASGASG